VEAAAAGLTAAARAEVGKMKNPDIPNIHGITEEQIQKITQAVAEAEKGTSGQIVPAILKRSDHYPAARWRLGLVFALFTGFLLSWLELGLHPLWIAWAEIPAFALGYALGSVAVLQRMLLAKSDMEEEVRHRALEIFRLKGLEATRDRTGILILISLYERRVQILADVGINAKVDPSHWQKIIDKLVDALGADRSVEGLCDAIAQCGAVLSRHFPRREDNTNELPDRPVIGV